MSVRCKFKVYATENHENETVTIKMRPVTSGSEENKQFYKWTPSGDIVFSTVNPEAAKQLEVGKEYYIDISPAA